MLIRVKKVLYFPLDVFYVRKSQFSFFLPSCLHNILFIITLVCMSSVNMCVDKKKLVNKHKGLFRYKYEWCIVVVVEKVVNGITTCVYIRIYRY